MYPDDQLACEVPQVLAAVPSCLSLPPTICYPPLSCGPGLVHIALPGLLMPCVHLEGSVASECGTVTTVLTDACT